VNWEGLATVARSAMQAIASSFGYEVRELFSRHESGTLTVQFQFFAEGEEAPSEFHRGALLKGGDSSWYLREFYCDGKVHRIIGWDLSRRKYPVICWRDDGDLRWCRVEWTRHQLKHNGLP